MSFGGESYAGSAAMTSGSTTTGGTFTFIAANIDGTQLIMGEFSVSPGDCALGAETGLILVNGGDIDINYHGPAQGDWPPAPPDTYYGDRLVATLGGLGEFTKSNEGGK